MRRGQVKEHKMHIRAGDMVEIIAGKDRATKARVRRGKVIEVDPRSNRIVVDGINIAKRAVRQTQQVRQGGIVEMPAPIDVSNAMLVCPACDSKSRIGYRTREDQVKVRVCRKCNADIDE